MAPAPAAAVVLAALLAGCTLPAPPDPRTAEGQLARANLGVAPLDFDALGAALLLRTASGCGHCSGQGGFSRYAEHTAFGLYADHRAVLVEYNARNTSAWAPGLSGPAALHVDGNISFPEGPLRVLLEDIPRRAQGHEVWVVRVTTAQLTGSGVAGLSERLARDWREAGPPEGCADCAGVHYWWYPPGAPSQRQFVAGPLREGDPFAAFSALAGAISDEVEGRGHTEGWPRASG